MISEPHTHGAPITLKKSFSFSSTQKSFLPQGLCTCCSLLLEHYLHDWFLIFYHWVKMSPPQRSLLRPAYVVSLSLLHSLSPCLAFLHILYHYLTLSCLINCFFVISPTRMSGSWRQRIMSVLFTAISPACSKCS